MAKDREGRPIPVYVPKPLPDPPAPAVDAERRRWEGWMADIERRLEELAARVAALERTR